MSSSSFDSEQYKTSQRQSWNKIAEGWQKWWKTFEQDAQKINDRLVELAEIKPGDKVLDIATGIGNPHSLRQERLVLKAMYWLLTYLPKC